MRDITLVGQVDIESQGGLIVREGVADVGILWPRDTTQYKSQRTLHSSGKAVLGQSKGFFDFGLQGLVHFLCLLPGQQIALILGLYLCLATFHLGPAQQYLVKDADSLIARLYRGRRIEVRVAAADVDAIRSANGIPHINHPNYRWSITADQLKQVQNNKLFEIFNGHPEVNNLGGGGAPGAEEIWDTILSGGKLLYGIAVDDAHNFKQPGNPNVAGPGRGWVTVRAARLEPRAILEALERGDFYASTGVVLDDVRADAKSMSVKVRAQTWSKYRIQFIGKGGRLLREVSEPTATYAIAGDEGYVRARVVESNGRMAWVQPVVVPQGSGSAVLLIPFAGLMAGALAVRRRSAHRTSARSNSRTAR